MADKKKTLMELRTLQIPYCPGSSNASQVCQSREINSGCVVSMLLGLEHHLSICEVTSNSIFLRLPNTWKRCNHPTSKIKVSLGSGAYGSVQAVSKFECKKTFTNEISFLHEMITCDLVEIARLRGNLDVKTVNIISVSRVCLPCKEIYFPRMECNLYEFKHWTSENVPKLISGFNGLLDAVMFLNEKCGLFHSDISPCNILVDHCVNPGELGRLVLSDLGLASLHTNNDKICIGIKTARGKTLYKMFYDRGPFLVCKDVFKPACVLFRCIAITSTTKSPTSKLDCSPVDQSMAKIIDVSCLALCLLYAIERLMDIQKRSPTSKFFDACVAEDESPEYYMNCLVPRVVMMEFLSDLWHIDLNIGASSDGVFEHLSLTEHQRATFQSWCRKIRGTYLQDLFFHCSVLLSDPNLKSCFVNLLRFDYFSPCGKQF
ncbi:virion protein kinase [Harp seal herpesvirus]|uniref:Virion protein kinase n=1 Tax=phocid gammaherpesvirus 3 TaxID=2560643 RepID=A0A0R5ZB31_9GAMA|nr:virion protein kinase [Harp seal herpesvirus]AJG42961.1 virion protein kinase [Harp seal herpesvirus]